MLITESRHPLCFFKYWLIRDFLIVLIIAGKWCFGYFLAGVDVFVANRKRCVHLYISNSAWHLAGELFVAGGLIGCIGDLRTLLILVFEICWTFFRLLFKTSLTICVFIIPNITATFLLLVLVWTLVRHSINTFRRRLCFVCLFSWRCVLNWSQLSLCTFRFLLL